MGKFNDNLYGLLMGITGGAIKWTLTIEPVFIIKLAEATIIAFICGLAGIAGKEFWYYIKKNTKAMKKVIERVKSETPIWFKKIINFGLTVAVAGGALLTAPNVIDGFVLPHKIELFAQWCVVAGIVASAVAKTAKTN